MASPVVVCLAFPPAENRADVERIRALDPRIEVVSAPYQEKSVRRTGRATMTLAEMRATAEPLSDAFRAALERADVMLAWDAPVDLARLAPKLRWVQAIAAGVEHFTGAGLAERGVVLTNTAGIAAPSMAEFVVGRLLMIWKRFGEQLDAQRAHEWLSAFGRTFAGSTVGIVGLGAIGSETARRLDAFGVTVLGVRRSGGTAPTGVMEVFPPERLHEMLGRCDAVVIAAPATPETHHLFDRAALEAMRPGAVLVNVARGSLVDEAALVELLRTGRLGAAVLDVFEREPLPRDSPLWDLPNVWISAHCSPSLDHYVEDVMDLFVENLRRWVAGEPLRNVVPPPPDPPV